MQFLHRLSCEASTLATLSLARKLKTKLSSLTKALAEDDMSEVDFKDIRDTISFTEKALDEIANLGEDATRINHFVKQAQDAYSVTGRTIVC
jgi:hypothetical protein